MSLEALDKKLEHIMVDPDNLAQIADASLQERLGFGNGIDPQELPEVIQFVARNGHVWLQYVNEETRTPTGVIEIIPLERALDFDPLAIRTDYDMSVSPLNIITANRESAFSDARRFADDENIVYHHGISMSRRNRGYGTLLLRHALQNTPGVEDGLVNCFVDAAQESEGHLNPANNESSYTVHMKQGFVLAGVVDPQVYDDTITYYSMLRKQSTFKFSSKTGKVAFDNPNVNLTIQRVTEITSAGYVGVSYDKLTHEMTFKQLRK